MNLSSPSGTEDRGSKVGTADEESADLSITDDETLERFDAFCKEVAREVRHKAAALGHPAEYEYLRQYPFILDRYRKVVPAWTDTNMDSVERACCDDSVELELSEINRIRKHFDEPPLDFIPEVQGRMRFAPPKPKTRPPHDEQAAAFLAWAKEEISNVHHQARARGLAPQVVLNQCPWMRVSRIQRHFPDLNPAWCLRQLELCLYTYAPKTYDEERIKALRACSDVVQEVGAEIEAAVASSKKPDFKQ
ncbi:MAG: hypothetical protein JXB05_01325 [Myxococcaceae bacterium]|nr:hypothetical protein [Myxococcaceae bacterium]